MPEIADASLRLSGAARFALHLRSSVIHHRWLIAVVGAYLLCVATLLGWLGRDFELFNWIYAVSALMPLVCWAAFLLFGSCIECWVESRTLEWPRVTAAFRDSECFTPEKLARVAIPLFLLPVFSSSFSSYKSALTALHPFEYDVFLLHLDRWIHGGTDPWRLLQPVLGEPFVTAAISYLYNLWLPVLYLFMYVMIFRSSEPRLRMQYLLTFAAVWIVVGSLMATGLSSAGPCYFSEITGLPSPYAPLMDYLHHANDSFRVWALDGQAYLWDAYSATELTTGGGISAMPSMHVTVAVLQALAGWRLDRRLGWVLSAYALVIALGSVHLGWHYAVDGYVGGLTAVLLWAAVGRFLALREL